MLTSYLFQLLIRAPATAGNAIVAQLVEYNLPKVGVAGSSPVYRSNIIRKDMKTKLKAWRLISAKQTDKVVTRDGREVLKWEVIDDPGVTLWATQVTVKDPSDKRKKLTYVVNHNGRRYSNVQSADDILIEVPVKVRRDMTEERDCMPDVMKAIEAAKNGDMAGVRTGNKDSGFFRKSSSGDSFYIGSNSDES